MIKYVVILIPTARSKQTCEHNYFGCRTGRCILNTWVCDGQKDCEDGDDELHCGEYLFLNHGYSVYKQSNLNY